MNQSTLHEFINPTWNRACSVCRVDLHFRCIPISRSSPSFVRWADWESEANEWRPFERATPACCCSTKWGAKRRMAENARDDRFAPFEVIGRCAPFEVIGRCAPSSSNNRKRASSSNNRKRASSSNNSKLASLPQTSAANNIEIKLLVECELQIYLMNHSIIIIYFHTLVLGQ